MEKEFQKFYHPDDDSGAVKIGYKFMGEEGELDLTDPEQYNKAKALIEKGLLYDKKMHELGELKRKAESYDTWAEFLEGVRTGEISKDELINTFEKYGIKLTAQEKKALEDDIEYGTDDARDPILKNVQNELQELKKKVQDYELKEMALQIKQAHDILTKKYDGRDGMPKYDPDEVAKYAAENGIYSPDPVRQYELAYFDMNREAILKAKEQGVTEKKLKQMQKRERAFVESGETNLGITKPKKDPRSMSLDEIEQLIDEDQLFTED